MKSLCLYCGSNVGTHPEYQEAAHELGTTLAKKQITLVYGGGNVGLMGVAADAALSAGGKVIGVIPDFLFQKEVGHSGLTELKIVNSMHERKRTMVELSDAFVSLPGGIGTGDEFFETFTWSQLGIHSKPSGILNINGFFDGLLLQLDRMVKDRFLREEQVKQLVVSDNVNEMLLKLETTKVSTFAKWTDKKGNQRSIAES